jgi:hypothetical protein
MTLEEALAALREAANHDVVREDNGRVRASTRIENAVAKVLLELEARSRQPVLSPEDASTLAMFRPIR